MEGRLPFVFEASGSETHFTNGYDPAPRARRIFAFPQPGTLARTLRDAEIDPGAATWRGKVRAMPELLIEGLRPAQIEAITAVERSLAEQRFGRSLVQMATGAGKTFTAVTESYRLLKHGGFKRVLFLVDRNNLGDQTLREFQNYATPDDGRRFTQLYNVDKLTGAGMVDSSDVVISTIQRVYAALRGEQVPDEDDPGLDGFIPDAPVDVQYRAELPPEAFDLIIVDEAHRSIYGVWRGVLEYFDAHIVGLTATPVKQTFAFFQQNLVSEYTYPQSFPWAVIGDLDDNILTSTARSITEAGLRESSAKLVPKGTLLIAMYGSIGKLAITSREMATNQAIAFAIPDSGKIELKYLFYYLMHQRDALVAAGKGATQSNISQTILKAWPIALAPLTEQRRIIEVLEDRISRLDAADDLTENAKKRLRAWQRRSLDSLIHDYADGSVRLECLIDRVEAGKSFGGSSPPAALDEWGIIKVSAMTWGEFRQDQNKAVPPDRVDPRYEIRTGDLLVSRANTTAYVGAPVLVEKTRPRLLLSDKSPASTPPGSSELISDDLGLVWSATTAATVEVVGKLWRADLERRSVLLTAAWVASAFTGPVREWLLNRQDEALQGRSGRHVGDSDIDALWAMCEAFSDANLRLGGGYARDTLLHYVNQVVLPLLHGSYSDTIGRELMAATARLCNLCAHMSFDSGRQGLAQRYYIQALRLAQTSGNRELGANILANMSNQAHILGNADQALNLATAGYRTALDCGSPSAAAKCAAHQGRAHALRGDQRACAQTGAIGERTLDRVIPTGERTWTKVFTADEMIAQRLYMARDLGRADEVQRIAPDALVSGCSSARRHVMYTTALAASYLPTARNPHSDIDRACELLSQALPSLGSLHSALSLERFNTVRRALATHATRPSVQEFEDRYRTTIMAAGTRA